MNPPGRYGEGMAVTSMRSKLQQIPASAIDVVLAVMLTAAVTVAISVSPEQGSPPGPLAYGLGPILGGLAMLRRRWPLTVLFASAAALQIYNLFDNPGVFAAIPLSVALATAWVAGRRIWALATAAWFSLVPLAWITVTSLPEEITTPLLRGVVSDVALTAAVLLLGEAVRSRQALNREHELLLAEQERSESLLLNVLPPSIADRLLENEQVIADGFPDVTVMFADLVEFTRHSQVVDPELLVQELNELFTVFDGLAERHRLEKIKTIGDAYMVAGGLPEPRPDHAEAVAEMALAMQREMRGRLDRSGRPLALRIGIDTGPVVAGVIGRHKFSYDLWGDTVNTASRMESHGLAGQIQVTERTYKRLRDHYRLEPRGPIQVKSIGEMETWFLMGGQGPAS